MGQAKGPTTHSYKEERVILTANIFNVLFTLFTGVPFSTVIPLKSVYFKTPVAEILFLSKLWYFQCKSKQKYHNFERNEIPALK